MGRMFAPDRLSRRGFLKTGAAVVGGSLLCGAVGAAPAAAPADDKGFWFYVISDLHYRNEQCQPFHRAVMKQIKELDAPVEFGLVTGDLANSGKLNQLQAAVAVLKETGKPFCLVIGNNDYQKPADGSAYEQVFPERLNYTFEHKGWQFIGIDSCDGAASAAIVRPGTLEFLDQCLSKVPADRPIVLFSHYPMDPKSWAVPDNAAEVHKRLKGRKVAAMIAGHTHSFEQRDEGETVLLTLASCSLAKPSRPPMGFVVCQAVGGVVKWKRVDVKG